MKTIAVALVFGGILVMVGCGRSGEGGTPDIDVAAPPTGLHWVDYQGIGIPVADQGPRAYSATVATGFADSPAGAGLAAIVHTVRMSVAPDRTWSQIAASELAPGPGKDMWVAARTLVSITKPAERATAPTILGYRITDYMPKTRAAVTTYSRYPDTSLAATHASVVWLGQDWLLELPDPASTHPTVESITEIPPSAVRLESR
ncbi:MULTISPECIES: hypothetical protein [unclassified Nocardia]|uniref:hypothetical protein n=1 Tax=unclassified Nocardia TaxID=2637762 RepID=UPI001CE44407|nr:MULTISPECIES: hypothetical protein [unclassified Nocardia]